MNDALVTAAGLLGMLIAVVHGYIGETVVVRPVQNIAASSKRVLHAIMFLSAVYWFVGGAVLATSSFFLTTNQQSVGAAIVGAMYLTGAAANHWATKGRHFGWMLLTLATIMAWLGAWGF